MRFHPGGRQAIDESAYRGSVIKCSRIPRCNNACKQKVDFSKSGPGSGLSRPYSPRRLWWCHLLPSLPSVIQNKTAFKCFALKAKEIQLSSDCFPMVITLLFFFELTHSFEKNIWEVLLFCWFTKVILRLPIP